MMQLFSSLRDANLEGFDKKNFWWRRVRSFVKTRVKLQQKTTRVCGPSIFHVFFSFHAKNNCKSRRLLSLSLSRHKWAAHCLQGRRERITNSSTLLSAQAGTHPIKSAFRAISLGTRFQANAKVMRRHKSEKRVYGRACPLYIASPQIGTNAGEVIYKLWKSKKWIFHEKISCLSPEHPSFSTVVVLFLGGL